MKETYLVTGVAGFIGSFLTKRLLMEGNTVVGVDNINDYYSIDLKHDRLKMFSNEKNFYFYQVDISEKQKLEEIFKKNKNDLGRKIDMLSKTIVSKPLVSIVIPVYNGENYLEEAIHSALNQSYENIEIIVVNDGSTDNTENIALKYKDKIKYFKKENGGVSSALNLGIKNMTGEYFSWLSHDDLYYEDKIERQIIELEKHDYKYKVISGRGINIDKSGEKISSPKNKKTEILTSEKFYKRNIYKTPNGCGFLINKDVLNVVGEFNENFKYIQDSDYWYRIAQKGFWIINFRQSIVKTRVHSKQATVYLKYRYDDEVNEMLINEANEMLINNKLSLMNSLYLKMAILGKNKIRKMTYSKHKKQYKVKLGFKIKYHFNTVYGTIIYMLKKIKRKYVNFRYRK